ncbi:MAG: hypothetical protein JSV91_12535 [Phycisphaerales bacterium]|nr:MAG: hypothetical protein JSV91_12535 [Phycisphaerales bacterium]
MNWRWLILDFIDPKLGLTRAQRSQVMSRVWATRGVQWKSTALAMAMLMLILPGLLLLAIFLEESLIPAGSVWLSITVRCLAFILAFPVALLIAVRLATKRALRDSLHAFGCELCRKCGHQLRGLDDYQTKCPECGTEREPIGCQNCGYPLYMIRTKKLICPECGCDQRLVRDPARWWRLILRQVTPIFLHLPDVARSAFRRRAFQASGWRLLIIPGLIVIAAVLVALAWYIWVAPMLLVYPLSDFAGSMEEFIGQMLTIFVVAMIPALVWILLAMFVHRTYGSKLRSAMRDAGYEICSKCGSSLLDIDAEARECPECGCPRRPLPERIIRDPQLPTGEEFTLLGEIQNEVRWEVLTRRPRRALIVILIPTLCFLAGMIVLTMTEVLTDPWLVAIGAWFPVLTVTIVWVARWQLAALRQGVREELRDRGHEVCMNCGAWLRGLGDDVTQCPMCPAPREPMPTLDDVTT